MLRNILLLCFLAATVAGQHYDQNKAPPAILPPTVAQHQRVSPGIYKGLSGRSNAKLCNKRKYYQFSGNSLYWVPTYQFKVSYPHNHKVIRDTTSTQLTPQFVEEEAKNVAEKTINDDFHEHALGVNEIKLNQDLLRTVYLKSQEDAKSVADQFINPIQVDAVGSSAAPGPPISSKNQGDPSDPGVLCRRSGQEEDSVVNDEDNSRRGNNDDSSDEVQKALKIISKCVQNAQQTVAQESLLRRSMSESPVDFNSAEFNEPLVNSADDDDIPVKTHKLRNRKLNSQEIEVQLQHPAKGAHVVNLADTNVMLMENGRVCYACSTTSDPTCLKPDKTTAVKYCKKADNACVTKVFQTQSKPVLTRDCANTCNENVIPGVSPKYKSCKICHDDLCNGAASITGLSMLAVTIVAAVISKVEM